MKVWVLLIYMGFGQAGGPTLIDNIVDLEECQRIQKIVRKWNSYGNSQCIEVQKAVVK